MKRISIIVLVFIFIVFYSTISLSAPIHSVYNGKRSELCILKEDRSAVYEKYLKNSVQIKVGSALGSGTICYFDKNAGFAYVISCGHLWKGNRDYSIPLKNNSEIVCWYKCEKLEKSTKFDAEVLFWSNRKGYDVSLLRFKPDWMPSCTPISFKFTPKMGEMFNSLGCDNGDEVARYEVISAGFESITGAGEPYNFITKINSPRPGRSGGGLISQEGELVGVCWGTTDTNSGDGIGFFTPLNSIKYIFTANQHNWLLETGSIARRITIVNHTDFNKIFDREYIPLPRK